MNLSLKIIGLLLILLPLFVWLLLYVTKRNDRPFLSNVEQIFKPLRLITWIPAVVLVILAMLTDDARFRIGLALIATSAGFGIVHRWIRKRVGTSDSVPQEDWWPAKKD